MKARAIITAVLLLIASGAAHALSYTVQLSEADLQKKVESRMPIIKKKLIAQLTIAQPQVILQEGSDRVEVMAHVTISMISGFKGTGTAHVEGRISYDPDKGEFYFLDSEVKSIKIDKLPDAFRKKAPKMIGSAMKIALDHLPVYRFNDDLKHRLAKAVLKSVSVKNRKLEIVLGL